MRYGRAGLIAAFLMVAGCGGDGGSTPPASMDPSGTGGMNQAPPGPGGDGKGKGMKGHEDEADGGVKDEGHDAAPDGGDDDES